jgi:hypothetical protein
VENGRCESAISGWEKIPDAGKSYEEQKSTSMSRRVDDRARNSRKIGERGNKRRSQKLEERDRDGRRESRRETDGRM